jgi:hypothetical protein
MLKFNRWSLLTLVSSSLLTAGLLAQDRSDLFLKEDRTGPQQLKSAQFLRTKQGSDTVQSGRLRIGTVDRENLSSYKTDSCELIDTGVSNESSLRAQNLRRCKDGTVSFVQPDSEGVRGYEGKCGQTAASNALFTLCRIAAHPKSYADYYLSDVTPGVRPGTLEEGLDDMFEKNNSNCPSGNWRIDDADNSNDFWNNIEKGLRVYYSSEQITLRTRDNGEKIYRKPVIAMIRTPGDHVLHWVTIVDLIGKDSPSCKVIFNHWDDQYEVPCYPFARWSYGVDDSYGPILSGYVTLRFE